MLPKRAFGKPPWTWPNWSRDTVKLADAWHQQKRDDDPCGISASSFPRFAAIASISSKCCSTSSINALEAMQSVPRAVAGCRFRPTAPKTGKIQVLVRDQRPGSSPAPVAHLFRPFRTTKPNGMGMGLSIARTVVEAHGGKIWAENQAGEGAAFAFLLPVEDAVP